MFWNVRVRFLILRQGHRKNLKNVLARFLQKDQLGRSVVNFCVYRNKGSWNPWNPLGNETYKVDGHRVFYFDL